jgi:hypothetical protein
MMMNKEVFMKEFNAKYKNKYTLVNDYVGENIKIKIRHNLCGYEDEILPEKLLEKRHRCRCFNQSKGEYSIEHFLINNDINYITQYSFEDLRHEKKLKFDFAVFDKGDNLKFLLEFDGDFHNRNIFGDLEKQQKRDSLKDDYCEENKIPLERISYKKINELDDILKELCDKYNIFEDGGEDESSQFRLFKYKDEKGNIMKVVKVDGLVKRNNEIYNIVEAFLSNYDIIIKKRYQFPDCRDIKELPFGFALFNPIDNSIITLIELLNESHFKLTYSLESFEKSVLHNTIKLEYCKKRNINLERIYYWDFDNIINVLLNIMKKYNIQYIPE